MFRPPALAIPSPRVSAPARPPSGHVYRVEGKRGAVWYAKCRLPDARQVKRKMGPAWSERGRPPAGYFTKRLAEDWLRELLDQARRGIRSTSCWSGRRSTSRPSGSLNRIEVIRRQSSLASRVDQTLQVARRGLDHLGGSCDDDVGHSRVRRTVIGDYPHAASFVSPAGALLVVERREILRA